MGRHAGGGGGATARRRSGAMATLRSTQLRISASVRGAGSPSCDLAAVYPCTYVRVECLCVTIVLRRVRLFFVVRRASDGDRAVYFATNVSRPILLTRTYIQRFRVRRVSVP